MRYGDPRSARNTIHPRNEKERGVKVRKAVIPVAGLGTRFLPATKAIPKEMLPIVDRPTIHYIVAEAVDSGITDIIFVTARGKEAVENHFDRDIGLEAALEKKGDTARLAMVREISTMASIASVRQGVPKGLGHAVWCARDLVGDEPFVVLLGDDLFDAETPATRQLIEGHERCGRSVIGAYRVPENETHRYGIIDPGDGDERLMRVKAMVEKPKADAPSNIAIIGRYLLTPDIFECIDRTPAGVGGEIQLTDAMNLLNEKPGGGVYAHVLDGLRYDAGELVGFIEANIAYALKRPELADRVRGILRTYSE
ncbi:UTP--glucose-1-phosphate uridylyltransferase GalU [bacterium]|nr:UTP--glucose-1-phosphate uridylyltransferase GalU [bacterium]